MPVQWTASNCHERLAQRLTLAGMGVHEVGRIGY
jgi:hypothetical protein